MMAVKRAGWVPRAALAVLLLTVGLVATQRPASDPPARAQAEVLDLPVTVLGIDRLYAAEIGLRFDPAQVTPVDAMPQRPGVQLQAGEGWGGAPFVVLNEVDPDAGTARFSATLLAPAPPLSGDRVLISLRLTPRRLDPEDAWGLTDVLLLDPRGQVLAASWEGLDIRPRIDWPTIRRWSLLPWLGSSR